MEKLLSEIETAEATTLSRSTLRKGRMTPAFGLPFVKVGRRVGYRPEDVRKFLADRVRTSTMRTA